MPPQIRKMHAHFITLEFLGGDMTRSMAGANNVFTARVREDSCCQAERRSHHGG